LPYLWLILYYFYGSCQPGNAYPPQTTCLFLLVIIWSLLTPYFKSGYFMKQQKSIWTYGFAVFAMFFGSGNLVFPLEIGFNSGSNWLFGFIGLLITGIILPFLGLFVIKLYKGSYYNFFGQAGQIAKNAIPFFTLSLLGSFGVVPRCITVAHGGMEYVLPDLSLPLFAFLFCAATFFLCLKEQSMVKMLGKWMSPILLIVLVALIFFGIMKAPSAADLTSSREALEFGFFTGYQTMDLFASFFFSTLIFQQIQQSMPSKSEEKEVIRVAIKASIIGSSLLAIIYLGLVFLGASYFGILENVEPEHMLPAIISGTMGIWATFFLGVAVLLSCITTAMALNNIYARYICTFFRLSDDKFPIILFLSTAISFAVSLLDFQAIANFLAPALDVSYPGLIVLTVMSILTPGYKKTKKYVFWTVTIVKFTQVVIWGLW